MSLINSLDNRPEHKRKESYKKLLHSFEKYIKIKKIEDIESKKVIQDYPNSDLKLFEGKEVIVHCFCVVTVKFSVESSVESLISRYEIHFDKTRQLTAHNAHMEMFIAENGPILVRADKLF